MLANNAFQLQKKWVLKVIVPEHDMETESFLFPPYPGSFDKQQ